MIFLKTSALIWALFTNSQTDHLIAVANQSLLRALPGLACQEREIAHGCAYISFYMNRRTPKGLLTNV